ncbi:MAG: GDSL-type esterase/lipase family protein [Oscillospiraceae bacterium]
MTFFYSACSKLKNSRAIFFALIIAMLFSLTACNNKKPKESPTASPTESVDPNSVIEPPSVSGKDEASPSPSTPASPSPSAVVGPDLPLCDPASDEFFADAAFMGNSLMDGFRMFSGLTTCDYYAATSMTVIGAKSNYCITLDNGASGTMVDGLTQKPYGKIYILLGINEIGYEVTEFIKLYGEMLDAIIAAQPDCDIYIMGLTPVSAIKSAGSDTFNMTRVTAYNDALHQLAADKGCYYLNLVEALAGADGFLPANETSDGVHFSANVYKTWLNYVKTHYVV